jgi:hypothetical protein
MSAAVAAAGDGPVVGIDAPNPSYLRLLWSELRARRPPAAVVRTVLRDLGPGSATRWPADSGRRSAVSRGSDPGVRAPRLRHLASRPASRQAAHERAHVTRRRSLLGAVATPPAISLVDESREADMARRLDALRAGGDVVAVIGVERLDAVETRLREA